LKSCKSKYPDESWCCVCTAAEPPGATAAGGVPSPSPSSTPFRGGWPLLQQP